MTKSITFGTIAIACVLFFALAFKSADNDKKDYVAIIYSHSYENISISYSNGTFKTVERERHQGLGDQTQLLKLINEQEVLGYKLINCDVKFPVSSSASYVATALLAK